MKDMRGVVIQAGDIVCYGKSNRDYPINIGVVQEIKPYDHPTLKEECMVLGKGNSKVGSLVHGERILVLPDDYLEGV